METNNHFFYVVKCKDNSWYAGYTNDLHKRVKTHNDGKGAKYTKVRRPVELIFAESFSTNREAMQAEYYFKKTNSEEKRALYRRKAKQQGGCIC